MDFIFLEQTLIDLITRGSEVSEGSNVIKPFFSLCGKLMGWLIG